MPTLVGQMFSSSKILEDIGGVVSNLSRRQTVPGCQIGVSLAAVHDSVLEYYT